MALNTGTCLDFRLSLITLPLNVDQSLFCLIMKFFSPLLETEEKEDAIIKEHKFNKDCHDFFKKISTNQPFSDPSVKIIMTNMF